MLVALILINNYISRDKNISNPVVYFSTLVEDLNIKRDNDFIVVNKIIISFSTAREYHLYILGENHITSDDCYIDNNFLDEEKGASVEICIGDYGDFHPCKELGCYSILATTNNELKGYKQIPVSLISDFIKAINTSEEKSRNKYIHFIPYTSYELL